MLKVKRRGTGLLYCTVLSFLYLCLYSCTVSRLIVTQQSHIRDGDTLHVMTTRSQEVIKTTTDVPLNLLKP